MLIGIVWACAVAGDLTSYMLGRRLGRGFLVRHGAAAEDHRGAARLRRGLLRPPRRHHDPDRALHRPRARDRAVPRRRVADGAAQVHPLRRARRRACGPRCSACSATSSGSRSTASRPTSAAAPPPSRRCRRWDRGRVRPLGSGATRSSARTVQRRLDRNRDVARACASPLFFVADHAQFGLELTTLLALAAVGTYVFFGLGALLGAEPLAPFDAEAFDLLGALYMAPPAPSSACSRTSALPGHRRSLVIATAIWAARHDRAREGSRSSSPTRSLRASTSPRTPRAAPARRPALRHRGPRLPLRATPPTRSPGSPARS